MSRESWIVEFYPVDAKDTNPRDAATHSLQKWRGLTREALTKHGIDQSPFDVDGDTCALCQVHEECDTCPIVKMTGNVCVVKVGGEWTPWGHWVLAEDPRPMIKLLEEVVEWEKSNVAP